MTPHEMVQSLGPKLEEVVRELLPGGSKVGHEWKCGDLSGNPGSSLTVELNGAKCGLWCDQATSEGGDLIDLIAASKMLSTGKAIGWLRDYLGIKTKSEDLPFNPLDVGFKRKDEEVWRKGSKAWTYRDPTGNPIAWVVRFDQPNGKKEILPLRIIDGKPRWKGFTKGEPKPIYNRHLLERRKGDPILIVEGEKTADAAAAKFPEYIVLTWMGGTKNVAFADWKPVAEHAEAGVEVILWPDADKPGREAMVYLKAILPSAHLVNTAGLPDGWDLADDPPEDVSIRGLLDSAKLGHTEASTAEIVATPFRPVGHTEEGYLYHSHLTGYLVPLAAAEHTEMNLQRLAPDSYWLHKGFADEKSMEVDYKAVAKHLIAINHTLGTFDLSRVRGRGCWIEPGKVIYHAGDHLIVNGQETPIAEHQSNFIYPARRRIPTNLSRPATADAGRAFANLCKLLPWAPDTWGWILPAALYLAPVCGALTWRPPLWLTGPPQSGKSWCCREIISPMLGEGCIKALSATTPAGLRQAIGPDAIPVTGDEFEAKDEKTRARIAAILELVRQATTETGWSIYHGTTEGQARAYQTRSMFIFSSIIASAIDPADMGRFAILEFHRRDDRKSFDDLCDALHQTIAIPGFCEAIRARAITRAPDLLANIEIFKRAVARAARDSRKGDTYGTLAAAAWSLENDALATPEAAATWANAITWDDTGAGTEQTDSDPSRVLDIILQHRTFIQNPNSGVREDITVGEMLAIYNSDALPSDPRSPACYESLMRLGLHPISDSIDVAVRHPELSRIFKSTTYSDHWADHLRRPPINAENSLFKLPGGNRVTRSVRLKIDV